jgi:hypothetical protein
VHYVRKRVAHVRIEAQRARRKLEKAKRRTIEVS